MGTTISETEMAESVAALSPTQRQAIHDFAVVISSDLKATDQPWAAWAEVAASLMAIMIHDCRHNRVPDKLVQQLKEFVMRRAEALAKE